MLKELWSHFALLLGSDFVLLQSTPLRIYHSFLHSVIKHTVEQFLIKCSSDLKVRLYIYLGCVLPDISMLCQQKKTIYEKIVIIN